MVKQQVKHNCHTYIDLQTANYVSQFVAKECCRDHNIPCKKICQKIDSPAPVKHEVCSIRTILNSLNLSLLGKKKKRVLLHFLYFFFRASATSHCQKEDLERSACQSCSNHRQLLNSLFGEWRVFILFTQHPSTKHSFCSRGTYA